jgi:hypothetical protein
MEKLIHIPLVLIQKLGLVRISVIIFSFKRCPPLFGK